MSRIPVWMDCDMGAADAIALMLLHASPELEVKGISTVCGNLTQNQAYWNTQRINGLMGTSYPVFCGAERPLFRELTIATDFHGVNGLCEEQLPVPKTVLNPDKPAWDALYACVKEYPGALRLVTTGPLTNIATAFIKYPDLAGLMHSVLITGGSAGAGNITPAAEFNIFTDPHAASIVFRSGVKLFMFGLDVTLQGKLTEDDLDELDASGTKAGSFARTCMQCAIKGDKRFGLAGISIHDACPVMYLVHPDLFEGKTAGVAVETRGTVTRGKTVTDLYSDRKFPFRNATVMLKVNGDQFVTILKDRIFSIG